MIPPGVDPYHITLQAVPRKPSWPHLEWEGLFGNVPVLVSIEVLPPVLNEHGWQKEPAKTFLTARFQKDGRWVYADDQRTATVEAAFQLKKAEFLGQQNADYDTLQIIARYNREYLAKQVADYQRGCKK